MKKTVLVMMAAALLVLAGTAAWAVPTINIIEPIDEALPVSITSTGFTTVLLSLGGVETATFNAWAPANSIPNTGNFWLGMMDANDPSVVSDYALLAITPTVSGKQTVTLAFYSEGATGFSPPASFDVTIVENGNLQNWITWTGLVVNAQSNVEVVPLPGALLLLGAGLVRLATYARRRRSEQA